MLRFECDYGEGAAPAVLDLLQQTNFDQTPGYGEDEYCAKAAAQIRSLCDAPDADVHFFVGATQANLTVIAAALKPWQGVLCADSGHIHVHETGAVTVRFACVAPTPTAHCRQRLGPFGAGLRAEIRPEHQGLARTARPDG